MKTWAMYAVVTTKEGWNGYLYANRMITMCEYMQQIEEAFGIAKIVFKHAICKTFETYRGFEDWQENSLPF